MRRRVHSKAKWMNAINVEKKLTETTTATNLQKNRVANCNFVPGALSGVVHTHGFDYVDKVVNANHIRFDWITDRKIIAQQKL